MRGGGSRTRDTCKWSSLLGGRRNPARGCFGASASIRDTARAPSNTTCGRDCVKSLRLCLHGTCPQTPPHAPVMGVVSFQIYVVPSSRVGSAKRKYGTCQTVKARIWPWLSGQRTCSVIICSIYPETPPYVPVTEGGFSPELSCSGVT